MLNSSYLYYIIYYTWTNKGAASNYLSALKIVDATYLNYSLKWDGISLYN